MSDRTLVGSDNGAYSPWDSISSPIIQTPDQKQWIDLELLNPKFLKGLNQYAPSAKDVPNSKLGKGAAKIKAWARQSKAGIDIRLRRKINAEKDEITEIHLVPDPYNSAFASSLEKPPMPQELPAMHSIAELADTAPTTELDAARSTSPSQPSRSSTTSTLGEPLPRYERELGISVADVVSPAGDASLSIAAAGDVTSENTDQDVSPVRQTESNHRPSISQSSIVATPTRGLSLRDETDFQAATDDTKEDSDKNATLKADLNEANKKLDEERTLSESLQAIIQALSEEQSQQQGALEEPSSSLPDRPAKRAQRNRLKVANRKTYETETEHEAAPQPPKQRRQTGPSRRKKSVTFPKHTQSASSPRIAKNATSDVSDSEPDVATSTLIRKQTLPKRVPSTAGAKAIWRSLIHTQTILLGPDNDLTIRAKSDFRAARSGIGAVGATKFTALQQSKLIATRDFGSDHPWVAAFCEDLERLEQLMFKHGQDTSSLSWANTKSDLMPSHPKTLSTGQVNEIKDNAQTPEVVVTGAPSVRPAIADPPLQVDTSVQSATAEKEPSPVVGGVEIDSQLDMIWNNRGMPHRPPGGHTAFLRLGIAAISQVAWNGITWMQRNYGPEQPVEAGKTRVRWTCSCGEKLHDDFIEKRPGAARALEAYLNRPKGVTHTLKPGTHGQHHPASDASPTTSGSSPGARSWNSSFNAPSSSQTSFSSNHFPNTGSWPPDSDPKSWTNTTPSQLPFSPTYEPPWLLTCATEDRLTPKVTHLDMSRHKIHSDKDLANSLRDHYSNVNKKWWKGLRLRGLISIEYAQFELHQNRFADIRKVPDVPLSGRQDYNFEPSDLLPPVGSHYLLHLFRHPEDYDGELITYLRSPKRNGRLQLGVGWGINLVEGFLADKVWIWMSAMFALGSLVFGIVYAVMKRDLQGAFGVAAWIVTLGGLGAGWLQACIG